MAAVTATVAAGLVGTAMTNRANSRAANATQQGNNAAIGEQRRQFDLTRQDMQPWMQAGTNALGLQQAFLNGDTSGFENSADYRFAVDQGFKGLDRGAAAGGNLHSGGMDADRIALGQGLATQYAGKYWDRLSGLSNTGQSTAGQLGQFGANAANNIGGLMQNSGNARASAYASNGANWGNALAGSVGWAMGQRKPGSFGPGVG